MINVVSAFGNRPTTNGPSKVFANLIKGLNKVGYPYLLNCELNATKRLWIPNNIGALYAMKRSKAFKVVGPNLFVLPGDIPSGIDLGDVVYLQPSAWARRVWEYTGFSACPIKVWPVGIDTDMFFPAVQKIRQTRVLIYHKHRDADELGKIVKILENLKLPYVIVRYGEYQENEYRTLLQNVLFVIWHGCHESQGIALQEALACNVPLLICDVTRLSQAQGGYRFPSSLDHIKVTAAPYFDESCGMKITDLASLESAITFMLDHLNDFAPREYILKHLSLEGQARAFVAIWEHWGLSFEDGMKETAKTQHAWSVPLVVRARLKVGGSIRSLLRKLGWAN